MDYKKIKADNVAITRNMSDFENDSRNVYETVAMLSKRANQISLELKEELHRKISEYTTHSDNLEEIFENREQIEIAKYYEQLPKPTLISVSEFINDKIYYRSVVKEKKA